MTLMTSLKAMIGAFALTVIAGMASAATTTFANFNSDGTFVYDGNVPQATLTSNSATGSLVTGGMFDDQSVVRGYTLNYSLGFAYSNQTAGASGTYDVGSFSIDQLQSFFGSAPTSGSVTAFTDAVLSYSGLTFPSSSMGEVDFTLGLGATSTQALLDLIEVQRVNGRDSGTFTFTASLTAETPDTTPVPLPAAAPMLLAGIGGLAAFRRKRRKAA